MCMQVGQPQHCFTGLDAALQIGDGRSLTWLLHRQPFVLCGCIADTQYFVACTNLRSGFSMADDTDEEHRLHSRSSSRSQAQAVAVHEHACPYPGKTANIQPHTACSNAPLKIQLEVGSKLLLQTVHLLEVWRLGIADSCELLLYAHQLIL